jgi:PAS domain S-box-containing protein
MQKISIHNLPVGIFKIDHNKEMIYVNKYFCKISKYPKEKLLGKYWLKVIHQGDLAIFMQALATNMKVGHSFKFEFRFTHHSKNDILVLCHIVPERNINSVLNYLGTITDITELKKNKQPYNVESSGNEIRYELALENGNIGLWDWEIGTQHVNYSANFIDMLGYSKNEFPFLFESFEKILHPEDHDVVLKEIDEHLKNSKPYQIEYRLKLKSGYYHWFQAMGHLRHGENDDQHMLGSLININQRKKMEQRLAVQYNLIQILSDTENLENVASKIVQVICKELEWDIGALWIVTPQLNVLECRGYWQKPSIKSQVFEKITWSTRFPPGGGLPGEAWITSNHKCVPDIIEDVEFPRAKQAKEVGMHSALVFPIILQNKVLGVIEFLSRDKFIFDDELSNTLILISHQIGTFIERKEAQAKLRENEQYKSAILESASDSILTIDEHGFIISCNPQTSTMFGYDKTELLGQDIEKIIPDLSEEIVEFIVKPATEHKVFRSDSLVVPTEISISKMSINNKNRYVIIIRDISERKRTEQLKNEFVSIVSHELRTPLTCIRGSLGLIQGGTVGDFSEKAMKLLDIANNNCERLLLLINDILDIEKIEAGKIDLHLESVDVSSLVGEAINANKMYGEKFGVKVKLIKSLPDVKINVDPDRVIQVLTNLISNAVKFSPEGEQVSLEIDKIDNNVRVSISDKGSGIPKEFQSRIFQKFSQADSKDTRKIGGTGLGLTICKKIIEKLNGTIWYKSILNQGSTFYFELPISEDTEQPEKKKIQEESSIITTQRINKLLICEDKYEHADYVRTLLKNSGFDVDVVDTVKQARKLLAKHDYKALLLDIILPDQDGISFIRELRSLEQTSALPIIVISVIAQTGRLLFDGDAINVIDWLDKPVDFNKLLYSVKQLKQKTQIKPHILHVENDQETQFAVTNLLKDYANVTTTGSIDETRRLLFQYNFDLIILDLILLDGNGVELLPFFAKYSIPIIVYSASELDSKYSTYVHHVLVKSRTSSEKLLSSINNILQSTD